VPFRRWIDIAQLRLRSLLRGSAVEHELDDELTFHLERATEEFVAKGLSRAEARRAAFVSLGGIEQRKEECREARGARILRALGRDLRFGFRMIARRPGFSVVAIVTLALGIGVTTAVYAVFNYALFRPVPGVRAQDELVSIFFRPDLASQWATTATHAHLQAMRSAPAFEGLAAYSLLEYPLQVSRDRTPSTRRIRSVTLGYFETLGVRPRLGRFFASEEYEQSARAVVISEHLWRRQLDSDPDVIGRDVDIAGPRLRSLA
jgi:hypothetical protein